MVHLERVSDLRLFNFENYITIETFLFLYLFMQD